MPTAQACQENGMSEELTLGSPSSQHSGMCWGHPQCLAPGGQAGLWPESLDSWEGMGGSENGTAASRRGEGQQSLPFQQGEYWGVSSFEEPLCVIVHFSTYCEGTGVFCLRLLPSSCQSQIPYDNQTPPGLLARTEAL